MDVNQITISRDEAVKMLNKYRSHVHRESEFSAVDREIAAIYELVAKGGVIINALQSIADAGVNEDGFPKLAIGRADMKDVWLNSWGNGSCEMTVVRQATNRTAPDKLFRWPAGTFKDMKTSRWGQKAAIPHIPPDIRPKRGLANYHVLFEAIWKPVPPVDPLLIRRVGKTGDIWMVLGAWMLTDIERAVMSTRMQS